MVFPLIESVHHLRPSITSEERNLDCCYMHHETTTGYTIFNLHAPLAQLGRATDS